MCVWVGSPDVCSSDINKRIYKNDRTGESEKEMREAHNAKAIPSPQKKKGWTDASLQKILENEKNCGDVIMKKTYISDPISKKVKKNNKERAHHTRMAPFCQPAHNVSDVAHTPPFRASTVVVRACLVFC